MLASQIIFLLFLMFILKVFMVTLYFRDHFSLASWLLAVNKYL